MPKAKELSQHPSRDLLIESSHSLPAPKSSLAQLLSLDVLLPSADKLFKEEISDESDTDVISNISDVFKQQFLTEDWREEKKKFFNFKSVGKRRWLHDLLMSDSSEDDCDDIDEEDFLFMCFKHRFAGKTSDRFCLDSDYYEDSYSYYGSSLICEHDKFHERQKKRNKSEKVKHRLKMEKTKTSRSSNTAAFHKKLAEIRAEKQQLQLKRDLECKRRKLWNLIIKKDIPKAYRNRMTTRGTNLQLLKKVSQACQRERRKEALRSQKISKEALLKARRMAREMLLYWRKFDKVEKEHRKKAEKEAIEQRKQDEEMREMKRQQRKLNFLITQTELYAHFMGKKMGGADKVNNHDDILKKLDNSSNESLHRTVKGGVINSHDDDEYDASVMKSQAIKIVEKAVLKQQENVSTYQIPDRSDDMQTAFDGNFSLANPTLEKEQELPQPKIFEGRLKSYQLKGMNWLVSLYEKGINGILADEMGLGKTVQSIVFFAYLAEIHNIWGPFLVVAPASTLHNWQQEFDKFLPRFKVLPYWGDANDRKSLRKYWNQKSFYTANSEEESPFHVLITSYQLIVQDVKYMQRIRWQYLVLDEAHAIKSSQSLRWKILLGYNCRNRLLLTGTPIQNSMAELWALLHFIMPTLFDNHDEFNEWFSKDIENHDKRPNLDQNQLSRLHMILKPFMLRRVKKDVENELSDKIEIKVMCEMSLRQKRFYQAVKNKILIEDLLQSSVTTSSDSKSASSSYLMNLVMQFRKVCNHPELFERKEPIRALNFQLPSVPLSRLIFEDCLFSELPKDKIFLFHQKLLIWSSLHVSSSLKEKDSCFGFTHFSNLSPQQCQHLFLSLCYRVSSILFSLMEVEKERLRRTWKQKKKSRYLSRSDLLICKEATSIPDINSSFRFTTHTNNICGHKSVLIQDLSSTETYTKRSLISNKHERNCQSTYYSKFLHTFYPKVNSPPPTVLCHSRRAAYHLTERFIATPELDILLRSGINGMEPKKYLSTLFPMQEQGFDGTKPILGWSRVRLPDRSTLISDSGKLSVLDQLLSRLKLEDHRVLIYSQMTKMIDLLEEFMHFRHYSYMRLDGSSKISDRRDMVKDFQSKEDIFAFLLSTRAGGLGINLTAADTVIFYDSDWNPTVDQQAMDRAHRLGQTKQVTVYRLVTKGTVEQRILNRAREKSEIQSIVISGGEFNKDVLRPKEVVSLLLDDEELERKLKVRQQETKLKEQVGRPSRKKKQKDCDNGEEIAKKMRHNDYPNNVVELDDDAIDGSSVYMNDENSTSSSIELGNNDFLTSSRPPSAASNSSTNTVENCKRKGRPPGKGRGKNKSGTLAKAAASAAALAGAVAGSTAAYAAYGYSFRASNGC